VDVLGKSMDEAKEMLGEPESVFTPEDEWDLGVQTYYQYQKKWGVLVLGVEKGSVKEVQFHADKKVGEVEICY
jgi:hypothetical protein